MVGANDWDEHVAQVFELSLGLGVEQGERGHIDGLGRILGVDRDGRAGGNGLAGLGAVAETDIAKQVCGVLQVRLDLGALETLTALGLGLVLIAALIGKLGSTFGTAFLDALLLGLLVGSSLGIGLGLGFGSLLGLFALYFRVFGGVPGVEDLVAC